MMIASCQGFGAAEHRYRLAPENVLSADIAKAPTEVREAYRFAIANRDTLRYIPCYCGCGAEGHMSNASCYVKDSSIPENLLYTAEYAGGVREKVFNRAGPKACADYQNVFGGRPK